MQEPNVPADVKIRRWTATLEQFRAFRDDRPKSETWELIDGELAMKPPPSLVHQRIAGNLETMLNARLAVQRPEWQADRGIGVHVPIDDRWDPVPDVTVIDADIELGQIYAERFYVVAEILSPHDRPRTLDSKRDYYRSPLLSG